MSIEMKYYKIHRSYEPSIIGLNDASAQVEILNKKTKYSFANENERQYFNDFVNKNRKDIGRATMDNFVTIETSKIPLINVFKTKKRVKEVDMMYYMPREAGFDIVFSKRFLEVIKKYKLPDYNTIKIKVEDFDTEYYLIGFPLINISEIDFGKSVFYDYFTLKRVIINDYEDYKNHPSSTEALNIFLKKTFEYDVLKIPFGIFFSEKLVDEIEKMELKALEIDKHTTLEC
jgi:hypothetical protein